MDRPIPTADPLTARYAQSRVEAIDVPSENWDDKVSEFVRLLMPDGLCTVERVAEHLGCNRRTMHRHLFENGTSFSGILDAERAALATRLIEDGNRPLTGIAELLGFSAQSAVARWFRGRFGCSITQWRNGIRPQALTTASSQGVAAKNRSAGKMKRASVGRRSDRLGR